MEITLDAIEQRLIGMDNGSDPVKVGRLRLHPVDMRKLDISAGPRVRETPMGFIKNLDTMYGPLALVRDASVKPGFPLYEELP